MKKPIIFLAIILLITTKIYANENQQGMRLDEMKSKMLADMKERQALLQKNISCIEVAKTMEEINACHEKMRASEQERMKKRQSERKAHIEEQIKRLEEEKKQLEEVKK